MAFEVDVGGTSGDPLRLFAVKNRWAPSPDALYTIDPDTGFETALGVIDVLPNADGQAGIGYFTGLAVDPTTGTLYASAALTLVAYDGHVLVTIDEVIDADTDEATYELTIVGEMGHFVSSLAAGPDGTLYAVRAKKQGTVDRDDLIVTPELMTVDKGTGLASPLVPQLLLPNGEIGDAITAVPARLTGTTTVSAVDGVATFNDLRIDAVGSAYTLTATAAGRAPATSNPFDVTSTTLAGAVDFTEASQTVSETAGSFDVTVRVVPAPANDVFVTVGIGGTASTVNDGDPDTDLDDLAYLQFVVEAGDADGEVTRTVSVVDDADFEEDETVVLTILDASLAAGLGTNTTHTVTITSDDPDPGA
jgi:hypothetical protein